MHVPLSPGGGEGGAEDMAANRLHYEGSTLGVLQEFDEKWEQKQNVLVVIRG